VDSFVDPATLRAWSRDHRARGHVVALVPTMGALHAGHLALIDAANRGADVVIVSIFVNPLQFDRTADFDGYPREIESDLEACRAAGVDAVYAPTAATMYPPGFQSQVVPGELAERLEGSMRPGHFQGVTTVVAKLIGAAAPDLAVFGQKDFQQLAIVRRMVSDLDMGVEIVAVPTVREADGLARSSRNVRLSASDRAAAPVIACALQAAEARFADGERDAVVLQAIVSKHLSSEPRARVEYVEIVDAATLEPVTEIEAPTAILTAVWFGEVRLIDNVVVGQAGHT
jgi:pantoate--beta-alanine ligase